MRRLDEHLIAPARSTPRPLRWLRGARLGLHLLRGVATALFVLPFCDQNGQDRQIRRWSEKLLRILNLRLKVCGEAPDRGGHLLLANHISWLDIYALFACVPQRFVAKAEVANWPVIGFLCRCAGTIFIERTQRRDTLRVNRIMSEALAGGGNITIFPEGTTSDGCSIKPWRSPLLQAALDARAYLQPVLLRYTDEYGRLSQAAVYIDDLSLGQSIARILATRSLIVEIHFLPSRQANGADRRQLARELESELASKLRELNR